MAKIYELPRWQRPKLAKRSLGISEPTMYRRIKSGLLECRKVEGTTYIDVGGFFEKLEREGAESNV